MADDGEFGYIRDMGLRARNGFLLLWLMLFFTVLALSSTSAILQRDTGLKRFREEDLKVKINTLRRAIDLYRYKYRNDQSKLDDLENRLKLTATDVAILLAEESFIRARVATGSTRWRLIKNYVKNSSFEIDDDKFDYTSISGWRGNYSANDNVPNGWQLTPTGAEQVIDLDEAGTWVVSFWARNTISNSKVELKVTPYLSPTDVKCSMIADESVWKRYFKSFTTTGPENVTLSVSQMGPTNSSTFVDGIMLEKWIVPTNMPPTTKPAPSAWTRDYNIVPDMPEKILRETTFENLIIPDSQPEDYSWWFQW